ncbi:MAG: protein phosphatase 2C domain-containing protein [Prolixibacteraceae bacterium]|jgi:serine/threonine protein phosphatase PrpC
MNDLKSTDPSLVNGSIENNKLLLLKETTFGSISGQSRIGGRKENQDSAGYLETKHGLLIVVCDGMGGANGGKFASQMAVDTILQEVANSNLENKAELLVHAIAKANELVYTTSRSRTDLAGMGTTVVALLIDDEKATAAHVGDSRIYQIRGRRKVFRTFDHSMVFELVKRGTISEEQARLSAESNVILRALGTKPQLEVEVDEQLPYLKGDRFLLCSDGICGAVAENELMRLISSSKDIKETTDILASTIDQTGFSSGGKHDNLTATLIQTNINSKIKPKMDKKSKIIIGIIFSLLVISGVINFNQYQYSKSSFDKEQMKIDSLLNVNKVIEKKLNDNAVDKTNSDLDSLKIKMEDSEKKLRNILNEISNEIKRIKVVDPSQKNALNKINEIINKNIQP